MKLLVTGGAEFIGSAVCRLLAGEAGYAVANVDCLTYASNLGSLAPIADSPRYSFHKVNVCDRGGIDGVIAREQPDGILHLAAESHVDRSITGPAAFIDTNIVGTYTMLQTARSYFERLTGEKRDRFRFVHISTDEVFGSLGDSGSFSETTPYDPSSPYSASKAASDHLVMAWHRTYGLPTVISNCSNNYGPYHFPEKLIPLMITNALMGQPLPVYGAGKNIRDWLYVEDHARALRLFSKKACLARATTSAGTTNERTSRSWRRSATRSMPWRPGPTGNRTEQASIMSPTGLDTISATPSILPRLRKNSAGRRARLSTVDWIRLCAGTSPTSRGGARRGRMPTRGSGSG